MVKRECSVCGKLHNHITKCRDGKLRCRACAKKQITNKWFIPKEQRVKKYSYLTYQEKQVLIKQGHSWEEINNLIKYMQKTKQKITINKFQKIKGQIKINIDNTPKINLMKGLKNG